MTSVALVPCLPPGIHPGMDALARGLEQTLVEQGKLLRVFPADLRGGSHEIGQRQERAMAAALAAGVEAIVLFVLDMNEPRRAVATALARGVPVVAIHKPAFDVSAAIVVPNYHQGVILAHALRQVLRSADEPAGRVAILGGPEILDDVELVRGAVDGVRGCDLELLNDPFSASYRNLDDVRGGGRIVTERILDDFYPFDGFLVFNDETVLDAIDVLEQRGLAGRLPTVSRNGSPAVIERIRRGLTYATLDYHLPEIGALAADTVLRCLSADPAMLNVLVAAPVGDLFTSKNVERYVPWSERPPSRARRS